MSKDSVMAYWIEADTVEFRSQSMGTADIFRGGTFETEVILKYARDRSTLMLSLSHLPNSGMIGRNPKFNG